MRAKEKLGKVVTIRSQAAAAENSDTGQVVQPYATVEYVEIVADIINPAYRWLKLGDARFVNYDYPPNGLRFELIPDETPPPEPGPVEWPETIDVTIGSETQRYAKA